MHAVCLDSNIYPNIYPNVYPNITPHNRNRNPNIFKHLNQASLLSDMVLICLGNVGFLNVTHQHITTTSYPTSKRLYYPTSKRLYHLQENSLSCNTRLITPDQRLLLQGNESVSVSSNTLCQRNIHLSMTSFVVKVAS